MPEERILTEPYATVLADPAVPCVIVQFLGFANSAEFRRVMETALAYFAAHTHPDRPWGWVGDVRQMSAIPQDVQDWLTTHWNQRAFAAGIREVSIVVAGSVLGNLATQQYVTNTQAHQDQYKQGARDALAP